MDSSFVDVDGVKLEYVRIAPRDASLPTIVMLHEGLGSVAMWREFPEELAAATGAAVVAYSRQGYGRSARLPGPRNKNYIHAEAHRVLPAFLTALAIDQPVLLGHSDGASIALLYAGRRLPSAGIVVMAPHVFIEDVTIASIAAAKEAYVKGDLRQRLARYHDSPDDAFLGWNDIWLDPVFRDWNIEGYVPRITVPMLVIQGADDEYGTEAQVEAIQSLAQVPCEVAMLAGCRHSPHRDQKQRTLDLIRRFLTRR
jgi:pimeloyl-ACP methyl ester carboxylesterase